MDNMECYNVRCKHFKHGDVQTVIHGRLIKRGVKRYKDKAAGQREGEAAERKQSEAVERDRAADHDRSVYNSMTRSLNKIYDISRSNEWEFFVTLTFAPDKVDRYSYSECTKKLSQWLKDVRKRLDADFRYLIVPERHKDGAFHFHGLFANCDGMQIVPSGHTDKKGQTIYNIGKYKLGFTTATAVDNQQAVNKYITKYVTKELCEATKGKKRYWASKNCDSPIEEIFTFDCDEKHLIRRELAVDAMQHKIVDYEIRDKPCTSEYFENNGMVFSVPDYANIE